MTGVGELLASAVLKQVGGKLATAMWKAIASQLKLGKELSGLQIMLANIQTGLRKAERRSMRDGNICVWLRELKAAAYDMEDTLMDFEYQISGNNHDSQSSSPAKEVSIPLKLRATMPTKLRAMKKRLETTANLKRFDFMADIISSEDQDVFQMQPTSPAIGEFIVGRIKDKADMMALLKEDSEHSIPIYGFGGIGKTALAKMVFNGSAAIQDFDIRVWVYVSEVFDLEKIGRSVISQVDGKNNQFDFPSMQKRVETILNGKRSLIVLDNIWEDDAQKLEDLRTMLKVDNPGNKIIVTTRSEHVAKRMNPKLPFRLGVLPYEDCWNLFKAMSFPNVTVKFQMEKEAIGQQIVKNCKGVPLAVKSLGYRLQNEPLPKWEETLQSELWEEEHDPTAATASTAVLPSLKISYYYMPYYLRPCFVYFSAFTKGFTVEKSDLIQRWIALGFVDTTHRAEEYVQELLRMSFLEAASVSPSVSARYSSPHIASFKMHDLVHELARSVAIGEVAISDANRQGSFGPKLNNCRYMLFSNFKGWTPKCNDMPTKARAIHFKDCTGCKPSKNAFLETKWLRVLDFSGMVNVKLLKSMRNLHHLHVLNLSENTCLEKLHCSICGFQKLHYLDLHGCSNLRELPEHFHKLNDLLHLDLSGCISIQNLPSQFGKLHKLSFLNLSYCSQLKMLPYSFNQLENLEHLNLSSCCQLKQLHTLSLEGMKKLLYLNISGCTSVEALPEFCGDNDGCLNLEILELSDCDRLTNLSESCARLHKLRYLNLSGCSCIQDTIRFLCKFFKLEYLNLSGVALSGFGVRKDSEAPSSSIGHSSDYSGEEFSLKMLHRILKNMPFLEYLSVGGVSLFSKEGISTDLLTLPDFVVATRGSGECSNITLLQNILDSTHRELNIRCLEVVKSAEEAERVELGRRHRLNSLSLEWSSSEWYTPSEPTGKTMAVLENLKPHSALKHLSVKGYNHSMFPSWIMGIHRTLPNLVKLVLSDLVWCDHIPTPVNLSNLEELEIHNMPQLKEACLAPCKNLKKLSLVALASGCTLGFCQDGWISRKNSGSEEIPGMELYLEEEFEMPEMPWTQSGDPYQGKGKTDHAVMEMKTMGNAVMMSSATPVIKTRGLMSDMPVSFSATSATKEAFPALCYLKIEYCQDLKLYPSIPNCEEYFINESNLEFTDKLSSTPILTRKMHIKSCPDDTIRLLQCVNISTGELVIDGHSMSDINKLTNQTIQKLKITNCEQFGLHNVPYIQSLQELEIDCINKIPYVSYSFICMSHLTKLTLSSPESSLLTDRVDMLENLRHQIQYIKINETLYFRVQESGFCLLRQNIDFGIMELFISNLENVNKIDEVDPGELTRYDQLCRLSVKWSESECHDSGMCRAGNWLNNDAHSNFCQGLSETDDSAVLQRLQPHPNLSTLRIEGYRGATICAWMSNVNLCLPNLVKIELVGMPRCEHLPPLGQLAKLEELHISDIPNIREVDDSIYRGRHPFRKLRKVYINKMEKLEVWSMNLEQSSRQPWDDDEQHFQGGKIFPCLKHLVVKGCPSFILGSAFQGCIRRIIESCSKLALSSEKIAAYSQNGSVLEVEAKVCAFSDSVELFQYLIAEGCPRLMLGSVFQGCIRRMVETYSSLSLSSVKCAAFLQDSSILEVEGRICGFSDSVKLLQHLIVEGCPRWTLGSDFLGCLRRVIGSCSEVELSSKRIFGFSRFSRFEVEMSIFGSSDGSELLQYCINLSNLTIKSVNDLITLPELIRKCCSLKSLHILDCWNFAVLPDWLGDLVSLEELEVHTPKLQCLPHSIEDLTSLKTLTLKKCNYKLRECFSSSWEDYSKIKHINIDTDEGPDFSVCSSNDMTLLQNTTSHQLIELNIKDLECLSVSAPKKIGLSQKEEVEWLSLEWSGGQFSSKLDKVALEELQPHKNLKRLSMKNYVGADFPNWICLPNLVRIELSNVQGGQLRLDHLQNLEDLFISSISISSARRRLNREEVLKLYSRSSLCILSTQPLKNLRRVTIARVGKLLWGTWTSHCIEKKDAKNIVQQRLEGRLRIGGESSSPLAGHIFPVLEYLEIDCCLNVRFKPSILRSARYIISGSKQYPYLFNWPSFEQVMGQSTSALSSKMEIKYSENLSSRPFDSLGQLNIGELTVDSCIDSIPLPESTKSWKFLQKLDIVNCENIKTLPEWLADMTCLREIKVETYWMKTLPPCIERLTSLQTLALSKCTRRFMQRCSETGDDWSKIKHIENVQIESRP